MTKESVKIVLEAKYKRSLPTVCDSLKAAEFDEHAERWGVGSHDIPSESLIYPTSWTVVENYR